MKRAIIAAVAAVAASAGLVAPSGLAEAAATKAVPVYDATYATLPGNVASVGFAATSVSELGDEVHFDGTARKLNAVTVTMSSWACESGAWYTNDCVSSKSARYTVPITLTIYHASSPNDDDTVTPGSLITRTTQSFAMPYRPTASLQQCNSTNDSTGKWYDKATKTCYNGKAFSITFSFKSLKLTLPDDVVIGVAYNTTNAGYQPIGDQPCDHTSAGCFYDSLNVGTDGGAPSVGTKPYPGTIFQNTAYAGNLCDSTPATGVFNLDSPTSPCWDGYTPNLKVTATN